MSNLLPAFLSSYTHITVVARTSLSFHMWNFADPDEGKTILRGGEIVTC